MPDQEKACECPKQAALERLWYANEIPAKDGLYAEATKALSAPCPLQTEVERLKAELAAARQDTVRLLTDFDAEFYVRHDHKYSGIFVREWLRKKLTGTHRRLPQSAESADSTVGREDDVAEIERLKAELQKANETWRCFECGFETADQEKAAAHFGDRDDAEEFKPLCKWWQRMSPEERGETLQDTIQELNAERDETGQQRIQIEGLEFRLLEFENLLGSRFKGCRTLNDAFNLYDSMEGRALAAEADLAAARLDTARLDAYEKMSQSGIRPGVRYDSTEGFKGWEWANRLYPSLRSAIDVALAGKPEGGQ